MATQYAFGKIVTDGLVLALDAADKNSYPGSGTTWRDMSGNNNNGTLTNGPTFNSANGGSIVFDGTNDIVNFGNILNSPAQLSVNFWIKNPNNNVIIAKGYRVWEIRFNGNEFGGYVGVNNGSSFWYGIADNNNILHGADLTQWNNFTYVFDYTNTNVKLYTNAVLKGSINPANMFSTFTPVNNLYIGCRADDAASAFLSGSLSNLQIYNKALSQIEILQNYNAQKSRFNL